MMNRIHHPLDHCHTRDRSTGLRTTCSAIRPEWEPTQLGTHASPRAHIWRHLPPLAGRARSAALAPSLSIPTQLPTLAIKSVCTAIRNFALTRGPEKTGAFASPHAQIRRHLPPLAGRAIGVLLVLLFILVPGRQRVPEMPKLGDRREAELHPPYRHAYGGPSPHLPAVFEALCRSSFLFLGSLFLMGTGADTR